MYCVIRASVPYVYRLPEFKGTIQQAPCMRVISVRKLYHGPIRLLADHDFTVRIQVESIARSCWMVATSLDIIVMQFCVSIII